MTMTDEIKMWKLCFISNQTKSVSVDTAECFFKMQMFVHWVYNQFW